MDSQHCRLQTNQHVHVNLVNVRSLRGTEWNQNPPNNPTPIFVFLPRSPVSHFLCFLLSLVHTWMHTHSHTAGCTQTHTHIHKQTNDRFAPLQLYNNCFGILANILCLLSLSMGYVIVYFHWECLLARTLISERLSSHTKEVLEINWRWSLQKLVAQ